MPPSVAGRVPARSQAIVTATTRRHRDDDDAARRSRRAGHPHARARGTVIAMCVQAMSVGAWIVCLAFVVSGCGATRGPAPADPARAPVALRLDGVALATPAARSAAADAMAHATQRRVEIVADDTATEAMLRDLAARLRRERVMVRAYDWREPRCAKHLDALAAARLGADGVYRLALDPGTAPPPARGILDVFRAPSVPVICTVSVRLVDGSGATPRAAVDGPALPAAVAAGVAQLPALPAARWDLVANGLVKAGCPFMALAVQDLQLRDGRIGRGVRDRALAAMARAAGRRTPAPAAPAPAPPVVADAPVATPPSPDTRYSCEALCGLHMVELCNKDRTLWNQNLVTWERTGCGTRRSEPFLVECYRRQRISGTFQEACVRPCEATPDGRSALLDMLQGAGCLRGGPS